MDMSLGSYMNIAGCTRTGLVNCLHKYLHIKQLSMSNT